MKKSGLLKKQDLNLKLFTVKKYLLSPSKSLCKYNELKTVLSPGISHGASTRKKFYPAWKATNGYLLQFLQSFILRM
ncbi:hypothetical protein AT05_06915 [Schleiferia thermophila str. Yellowstone]|nr:hypothetical protein AT05_06915 [Schleiferia thermophila str. Yellowstone]